MLTVAPSGWNSAVDYDHWSDPYTPDDKIIVHHGGNATRGAYDSPQREMEVLRAWEHYHLSKGWRGLAYGWAVGMSGTVYRIRGWNSYGAHRGDLEEDGIPENEEGIPIVFISGGDQEPTVEALDSFEQLVTQILEPKVGRPLPVYGHQEIAQLGTGTVTGCPGRYMEHISLLPNRLITPMEDNMFVLQSEPESKSKRWRVEWWQRRLLRLDPTLAEHWDPAQGGSWGIYDDVMVEAVKTWAAPAYSGKGIGPGEADRIETHIEQTLAGVPGPVGPPGPSGPRGDPGRDGLTPSEGRIVGGVVEFG